MKFAIVKNYTPEKEAEPIKVSGKLIDNGKKIVLAIEEGKNFLVKVIPVVEDMIVEVIDVATPLFHQLAKLFATLFRKLPTHIDYLGNIYRLTMQPAYGDEMLDKVFYLIEKEKKGANKILFSAEAARIFEAKNKIRALLKSKGLIS